MRVFCQKLIAAAVPVAMFAAASAAQTLSPEVKAKVEAKAAELRGWGTEPAIVAAVKGHNAGLSGEEKAMTNQKWSQLTVLDPFVRAYTKNAAAQWVRSRKGDEVSECFISGADGTKVAFLSKTTSWSHADNDKHRVPMSGKVYIGPVAMDESTGTQEVQVGLPVLDGGKPIGSIVVGLALSRIK